ncbi:MAG: CapA family protein [Desulfovibrio sp.]|jgi:UDP-N-acetylmuramyl pentapeptide synthase/poly-gamma-glutamate capsule biosynthesis protein CapA/YwtB (metallophosphatase superfamily)|nr:CapA family protein [Desulfovibrio sp.]
MKRADPGEFFSRQRFLLPPEGVDGLSLHALHSTRAFWTEEELIAATAGVRPAGTPPFGRVGGFAFTLGQFRPDDVVCCFPKRRFPDKEAIAGLMPYVAGVLCEDGSEYLGLGLPVLEVADVERALLELGRYARDRFRGKVAAVTGSSGKTGTTYALGAALACFGVVDHSRASGNMLAAVGRTMASLARDIDFWVIETAFARLDISAPAIRPDAALVVSIHETHLAVCKTTRQVAKYKSRIFSGMAEGACAVLNGDMNEYAVVEEAAQKRRLRIILYGRGEAADVRLLRYAKGRAWVRLFNARRSFSCALSEHDLMNGLGALACVHALGEDPEVCLEVMARARELPGRGRRHCARLGETAFEIIDDCYNANPGSMRCALDRLRAAPPASRLAILGECATLGEREQELHLELLEPILAARPDRVLLCGRLMLPVWERLQGLIPGKWYPDARTLLGDVRAWIRGNDTVLLKSSGHMLTAVARALLGAACQRSGGGCSGDVSSDCVDSAVEGSAGPVMAFGGKINIESDMHLVRSERVPAYCLEGVTVAARADFFLAGLHCHVAGRVRPRADGEAPVGNRERPKQISILLEGGVGLALLAGGYAATCGPETLLDHLGFLEAAGLAHAGAGADLDAASSPAFVRVKQLTAAVFSLDVSSPRFAAGPDRPGAWHLPPFNPDLWYVELLPRIAAAGEKADVVLVAVHWGEQVPKTVSLLGRAAIAAGADAVLGSSARGISGNDVRGVEIYAGRPIFHDAGVLLTCARLPRYPDAGLFSLVLSGDRVAEVGFHPLVLGCDTARPAKEREAREAVERFARRCAAFGTIVRMEENSAYISLASN